MFKIQTLNAISVKGLERLPRDKYEVASEIGHADAILLRSHKLTPSEIAPTVKAIARAGAGVNNVPVEQMTELGIPVFNTPGANANAVKELVLAGLLLGSRGILQGIGYANSLKNMDDAAAMNKLLEKEKKRFSGQEIAGKTLGVIGLGAIGARVARMGLELGMEVLGYDPAISVDAAWRLPSNVKKMENLQSLLARADFVTLHLPVLESTYHLINAERLATMKPDACVLNFARGEIVDNSAIAAALNNDKLRLYVTDFPAPQLFDTDKVILMPHIGASTREAEENCAVMAAEQLMDFLENGNIKNSVNFPTLYLERTTSYRLALVNKNVPRMLGGVLSVLADLNINVVDMLNKSRDEIAYNLIDIESPVGDDLVKRLHDIEGVISVRAI